MDIIPPIEVLLAQDGVSIHGDIEEWFRVHTADDCAESWAKYMAGRHAKIERLYAEYEGPLMSARRRQRQSAHRGDTVIYAHD